jgi:NADH:ubiquinone oxidoreductase subunit 6 (subunit J)
MSFALYMLGFLIFIAGLAWAAMVAGVPQLYIIIGAVILLGLGIVMAVSRTRAKDPPAPPPSQ